MKFPWSGKALPQSEAPTEAPSGPLVIPLEPIEIDGLQMALNQVQAAQAKLTQRCLEIVANRRLGPVADGTKLSFSADGKSLVVGD